MCALLAEIDRWYHPDKLLEVIQELESYVGTHFVVDGVKYAIVESEC